MKNSVFFFVWVYIKPTLFQDLDQISGRLFVSLKSLSTLLPSVISLYCHISVAKSLQDLFYNHIYCTTVPTAVLPQHHSDCFLLSVSLVQAAAVPICFWYLKMTSVVCHNTYGSAFSLTNGLCFLWLRHNSTCEITDQLPLTQTVSDNGSGPPQLTPWCVD